MDILSIINFAAPLIVIFLTKFLKRWVTSRWAPLCVFTLGGISTLIGVGPSPGEDWISGIFNIAYVSGGATLIYDIFKKAKSKTTAIKIGALILAFGLLATSCANFESVTYKTLYTTGIISDASMKSAGELYRQGKIDDEQVAKIIEMARIYYTAYHEAVVAFEIYRQTKSVTDKEKLIAVLNSLSEKFGEIKSYIDQLKK